MPAYVLVAAKGSPGVTTSATALAAVATTSGRSILAELDPSGGSISVLTGQPSVVGLVDAATLLRRVTSAAAIDENATMLPHGVATLLAPNSGPVAESVIASIAERWVPALRAAALDVIVDAGRWEPSQTTARRILGADLMVVVVRPTVASVESTRHLVDRIREVAKRPAAALVVGGKPYPPEEVAAHLDMPLAGAIAWDPRGATNLWATGVSRSWMRTMLARSAAAAWSNLFDLAAPPTHLASSYDPAAPPEVAPQ
jgi:Flp pilus assembly CpaE family ATPase